MVNSSLVDDPTIRQLGFDLSRCYWALLNHFRTNQGHCASCQKKWGLAATDICPCDKCQTMSHIVNSCLQSKLEGAAAIALSWWCSCEMAEDIQLINALDNNNSIVADPERVMPVVIFSGWNQFCEFPLGFNTVSWVTERAFGLWKPDSLIPYVFGAGNVTLSIPVPFLLYCTCVVPWLICVLRILKCYCWMLMHLSCILPKCWLRCFRERYCNGIWSYILAIFE